MAMFSIFSKSQSAPIKCDSPLLNDLGKIRQDTPVYIVMVQDFMSLANYGGFLRALKIFADPEEGLKYLYSRGQREPGLVVAVVAANNQQPLTVAESEYCFPESYEAFRSDWIVLRHEPTEFVTERFGICEIVKAAKEEALPVAVQSMMEADVFSVVGRIYEIADAEHGPVDGIKKISGRASVKGIG